METVCPRCQKPNRPVARFCANCGMVLDTELHAHSGPGRVPHPHPQPVPPDFVPVADAAQLYFRWESALGGQQLIGTEGVSVRLFNGGYGLRDVELIVSGEGRDGVELFRVEQVVEELPAGATVSFEVPSYQVPAPMRVLRVALKSAAFAETS